MLLSPADACAPVEPVGDLPYACAVLAVIATYRLEGRTSRSTPLRVVFWTFAMIFVPTLAVIVMIAALLRSYGCDIAYVTAWTNPFGRLPQILAVSGIGLAITGVALLTGKLRRKVHP